MYDLGFKYKCIIVLIVLKLTCPSLSYRESQHSTFAIDKDKKCKVALEKGIKLSL